MPEIEQDRPVRVPYEAPRVERVLTAEDLLREVQYAGVPSDFGPG